MPILDVFTRRWRTRRGRGSSEPVAMEPDMAAALVDELSRLRLFNSGVSIQQATIVHGGRTPILVIRFIDSRHPDVALGAWWDFHDYEEYIGDPSRAAWLASHAAIWLDEVVNTVAIGQFTEAGDGVRWAMMDYPSPDDVGRLPPHRALG